MEQLKSINLPQDFSMESFQAFYGEVTNVVPPVALVAAAGMIVFLLYVIVSALFKDRRLPPTV